MRYDYITGSAYPESIKHEVLPETLVDVSEEDHQRIVNRTATQRHNVNQDGSVVITDISETVESKVAVMGSLVQAHLDEVARAHGFDNINKAMLGAQFPGDHQAASQALGSWYYASWSACKQLLAQWQAGQIDEPTIEVVMAALPSFELNKADK